MNIKGELGDKVAYEPAMWVVKKFATGKQILVSQWAIEDLDKAMPLSQSRTV